MKTAAVLAVIALVIAAFSFSSEVSEEEPVLGILGVDDVVFGIVVIAVVSAVLGWQAHTLYDEMTQSSGIDSYVRGVETKAVAQSIMYGLSYYDNALSNYSSIWPLTNEHHIRQSELASSYLWKEGKEYSPGEVLLSGGVYLNASYLLRNASAQVNSHFDNFNERIQIWNETDTYAGRMNVEIKYGLDSISSNSSVCVHLGTSVNVSGEKNKVYLSGGELWVFDKTVIERNNVIYKLEKGCNILDDLQGFEEGIYTLQEGKYSGNILPVVDVNAASVNPSLILKAGEETKLAVYTSEGIVVDDVLRNDITITINPEGAESQSVDISLLLEDYCNLLEVIRGSIIKASNSAAAVWSIFDKAGESNTFLTTLMMPDIYENVSVTKEQKEVLTVLAMEQLADYYNRHEEIKESYTFSSESLSLYVRGDVYDNSGEKLCENVIFTPFVYEKDLTLTIGRNVLNQSAVAAVWSLDGVPLSSWNPSSNEDSSLLSLSKGCVIDAYEIYYGDKPVNSIELEVTQLDLIDPTPLPDPEPMDSPEEKGMNVFQIVCVALGIIVLAAGLFSSTGWIAAAGIGLILLGLLEKIMKVIL